ncbi:hypothetical protein YSY43_46490 [Paenibacillus sp. YSY-4.3]
MNINRVRSKPDRGKIAWILFLCFAIVTSALGLSALAPQAAAAESNLALGKTAVASSIEDEDFIAANAVDGSATTRWASLQGNDPSWIYVDLGETQSISKVRLNWEAAYAKSYTIQISNDNGIPSNWTDVYSTVNGVGGVEVIDLSVQDARYVRVYGTERGTEYGYSLYDFEVYGAYDAGAAADNASSHPEWNADTAYTAGQRVEYGGITYEAKWWTLGDPPNLSGEWDVWKVIGPAVPGNDSGNNGTPDTIAPTAPSGLAAGNVTQTSVRLTWNASTDNVGVSSYIVYLNGNQATSVTNTSADISGLTAGTSYSFTVVAKDAAGNQSPVSSVLLITTSAANTPPVPTPQSNKIIAYMASWVTWNANGVKPEQLTHINYAFSLVSGGKATLTNQDANNLRTLVGLKSKNPSLKVLVSVGGWGADGFSDAALTDASRTTFADSIVQLIKTHQLDGVDLDWEYPTNSSAGIKARPEDKQNFTLMLSKIREKLDAQGKIDGKTYLLTIAAGASNGYLNGVEIGKITPLLDWINLMTYDFHGSWDKTTGHHTNLYNRDNSVDAAVKLFKNNGVPASKLVIGGAFYGRGWHGVKNSNNGLDQPVTGGGFDPDYNTIVSQYLNKNGYTRYWDNNAQAPYLFNGSSFITYDDPQSLKLKVQYLKNNNLGGIMFWEYSNDRSGELLAAIYSEMTNGAGNGGGSENGNVNPGGNNGTSPTGIGPDGFLKTSGTVIRDRSGTGNIVNLRGTNLGGWMLQEGWMSPLGVKDEWTLRETLTNRFGADIAESLIATYQNAWLTTKDLDNIKDMGMNVVRVPILYLELMDKYGNWKKDPWSKLDWLVKEAGDRGIYVLLDLHGTFGAQNTFDNSGEVNSDPQLWKNPVYQDRTVKLWEGIATHYKGNPTIAGYDLLNEPDRVSKQQLNAFYDRLYKAIRAIDPDHTIYMEAAWSWNQLDAPSTYGWTNVVYEMHYYAMAGSEASNWNAQNNLVNNALQGIREHQRNWNVPVFVGEFCLFDFNDLWEKFLAGMNESNVSWTNWTYKVSSNYGNWGYFNNNPNPVPNISSDSASTISSKWSKFNTENFRANTTLQNLVKKYTTGTTPPPAPSGYSYLVSQANQQIVSAENYGNDPLVANRASAGDWELFEIITNNDGTLSLKSKVNGKYVAADLNISGKLIARSDTIQQWEKFKKVDLSDGAIALQALANNKYVSVDLNNGAGLIANRDSVGGAWEAFRLRSN